MWLARQAAMARSQSKAGAGSGDVTIGAKDTAVMLESEKRELPTAMPGGYFWKAQTGQEALVVRGNDGDRCVVGLLGQEEDISPGEVVIRSEGGRIKLGGSKIEIEGDMKIEGDMELNGEVRITGKLFLNGVDVGAVLGV